MEARSPPLGPTRSNMWWRPAQLESGRDAGSEWFGGSHAARMHEKRDVEYGPFVVVGPTPDPGRRPPSRNSDGQGGGCRVLGRGMMLQLVPLIDKLHGEGVRPTVALAGLPRDSPGRPFEVQTPRQMTR